MLIEPVNPIPKSTSTVLSFITEKDLGIILSPKLS
jgi:hypothetical protein